MAVRKAVWKVGKWVYELVASKVAETVDLLGDLKAAL